MLKKQISTNIIKIINIFIPISKYKIKVFDNNRYIGKYTRKTIGGIDILIENYLGIECERDDYCNVIDNKPFGNTPYCYYKLYDIKQRDFLKGVNYEINYDEGNKLKCKIKGYKDFNYLKSII